MSDPHHASLDECLITDVLARRPSRSPDYSAEAKALAELAAAMAGPPQTLFEKLAELILQLGPAESSGVSFLQPKKVGGLFRWPSIAGKWAEHPAHELTQSASLWGIVFERTHPLLFDRPQRLFPELAAIVPPISEVLLVPFSAGGKPVGLIWTIIHSTSKRFEAEDVRLLTSLSHFATVAYKLQTEPTDRVRQAEASLQESEERLRRALAAARMGIWTLDLETGIQMRDGNLNLLLGLEPVDSTQQFEEFLHNVHPDDRDRVRITFEHSKKERRSLNIEFRIVRPNGHTRWLRDQGDIFKSADGRYFYMAGAWIDVTERREAEDALRASEAKLAVIFSRAAVGLSEIAADGRFLRVNDELCTVLGRPRNELLGAGVADVTHPEDLPRSLAAVHGLLKSGSPVSLDKRYVRSDGSIVFATSALTRLETAGDEEPTILAVTVDLTDRKRAEEAVRLSEERLRLIIESATDYAIFTLDEYRNVTLWSAGAATTFGYSESEMIGRSGDIVFTPEDREAGIPEAEANMARNEGRALDERWHLRKDGSRFYASGVTKPLRDGGFRGFVKVARDLTEWKRFEEELQAANDLLEIRVAKRTAELAASNQSLHAEMAARNQLQRRLMSAQEDERLRISRELHDQIGQLLAGLLLGFRAIENGVDAGLTTKLQSLKGIVEEIGREVHNLALELRPTALDDLGLVAATQNYVESWAARTGIDADFFAGNADRLPLDIETVLYRIIQEALNNVLKHAGATRVSVILEKRNNYGIAIVEDNGRGIVVDKEIAAAQARGRLGVLGMRERLAAFGGTLEFESSPGEGTTIYARVPLRPNSGDNDGPEEQHV